MRDLAELVKGSWKIRLHPAGRTLSEMKMKATQTVPRGKIVTSTFADNGERARALDARVAELVAQGWTDTGLGLPKRARGTQRAPPDDALEEAFASLVESTLAALRASVSEADDAKAWRAAIQRYGDLKAKAGGNRDEHLVHFFAVDGVALSRTHPVVLERARATKGRKARWLALLERTRS